MIQPNDRLEIKAVADPAEAVRMSAQIQRHDRNWDWIEAHAAEVYSHRGKFICVAGQELRVGESLQEVLAWADSAHPEDDGRVTRFIPIEKGARIYANGRVVAVV